MAGEVPPLNVEVLVSLGNLTNAVNQATEGLNKIGNTAKAQESKFGSLKTTMVGVFAGNILAEGMNKVVEGLKGIGDAVIKTQAAQANLQTSVRDVGQNFVAATPMIESYAKKMTDLGFTHAETYAAIAKLTTATGSVVTATNAMGVAADLARTKNMSLMDATELLARSTAGGAKGLQDLNIKMGVTIPKAASFADILAIVENRTHGAADAFSQTLGGQLDITKAKFDDMQVALGEKLVPTITKLANFINNTLFPAIEKFGKVLSDLKTPLEFVTGAMIAIFAAPKIDALLAAIRSIAVAWGLVAKSAEEAAAAEAAAGARGAVAGLVRAVVANPITAMVGIAAATGYGFYKAGTDQGPPQKPTIGGKGGAAAMALYKEQLAAYNASQPKQNMFAYEYQNTENSAAAIGGGRTPVDLKAAAAAAKAAKDRQDKIKTQLDALHKLEQDYADRSAVIQRDHAQQVEKINRDSDQRIEQMKRDHNVAIAKLDLSLKDQQNSILDTYNQNVINAQNAAADQQLAIVKQSIALMTSAFENATKFDIATLFSPTGTTTGLIAAMQSQLKTVVQFQKDIGDLAGKGYSQAFIDQIIAQGSIVGDQMAQALLKADPTTTGTIQDLYKNIQDASGHGLDALATQMNQGGKLATDQLTASYAQVSTDLNTTLVNLAKDRDKSMADALKSYQTQLADLNTSYNNSLADANQALQNSLADAQVSFNNQMDDLLASTLKSLAGIKAALAALKVASVTTTIPTTTSVPAGTFTSAPLTYTTAGGFSVPNAAPIGPGLTIHAPITVDGSTAPSQIQSSVLSLAKLGALANGSGTGY
jgi:hypothetical protein